MTNKNKNINKILTKPETDVEIAVGFVNVSGIMFLKNAFSKAGNLNGFICEKDHACSSEESFPNVGKKLLLKLVISSKFNK